MTTSHIFLTYNRSRLSLKTAAAPFDAAVKLRYGTRLAELYALLKAVKPSNYNHQELVTKVVSVGDTPPPVHACGSIACAFGHAVISGRFEIPDVTVEWGEPEEDADGNPTTTYLDVEFSGQNGESNALNLIELVGNDVALQIYSRYVYRCDGGCEVIDDCPIVFAADTFFGPGAWLGIFDERSYDTKSPSRNVVLNRIKKIAETCYGVEVG